MSAAAPISSKAHIRLQTGVLRETQSYAGHTYSPITPAQAAQTESSACASTVDRCGRGWGDEGIPAAAPCRSEETTRERLDRHSAPSDQHPHTLHPSLPHSLLHQSHPPCPPVSTKRWRTTSSRSPTSLTTSSARSATSSSTQRPKSVRPPSHLSSSSCSRARSTDSLRTLHAALYSRRARSDLPAVHSPGRCCSGSPSTTSSPSTPYRRPHRPLDRLLPLALDLICRIRDCRDGRWSRVRWARTGWEKEGVGGRQWSWGEERSGVQGRSRAQEGDGTTARQRRHPDRGRRYVSQLLALRRSSAYGMG